MITFPDCGCPCCAAGKDLVAEAEAQVAAAVQAEREAIAAEHDCGCAARVDVLQALDGGMRGKDAAARFCPASPNCCAVDARAIRARGPSDALAAALRQARVAGMREAAAGVKGAATALRHAPELSRVLDEIAAAILDAAAKEQSDGE